jgi:hypothetical protein
MRYITRRLADFPGFRIVGGMIRGVPHGTRKSAVKSNLFGLILSSARLHE